MPIVVEHCTLFSSLLEDGLFILFFFFFFFPASLMLRYDEQGSEAADKCSFLYGYGWLTKEKRAYNLMGHHKTTFLVQAMLDWKKNTCVQ